MICKRYCRGTKTLWRYAIDHDDDVYSVCDDDDNVYDDVVVYYDVDVVYNINDVVYNAVVCLIFMPFLSFHTL